MVGVVCPGDCVGGVVVSSGFTVEEDSGFVVVTVVGVVCPGNGCGEGVVGGADVVSSGFVVVIVLEVVSSLFTVEEDHGFVVVVVVGVVCPGNCCGGGEVPGANVVISGLIVVGVLEVISCGFNVDKVVGCGFVVVALVDVVCSGVVGDCCGGGVVGGVDVVNSGFAVVSVLEFVSEVVGEANSKIGRAHV